MMTQHYRLPSEPSDPVTNSAGVECRCSVTLCHEEECPACGTLTAYDPCPAEVAAYGPWDPWEG